MFLKFPVIHLPLLMEQKILQNAAEMFLNYGFKSVTMDDIANSMGISKKTIYQYFENKTKLVEATTMFVFENISHGIDCICGDEKNPIEEIFEIKKFMMEHLKDEKSSPQFQLQKYYPKIFSNLKRKQFEVMQQCKTRNLERGIRLGLYRENIDVSIVSRIYFNSMVSLKDKELFPLQNHSMNALVNAYLEYHLRGICTEKGITILTEFLKENTSNQ